jgi:hypothetical protein
MCVEFSFLEENLGRPFVGEGHACLKYLYGIGNWN